MGRIGRKGERSQGVLGHEKVVGSLYRRSRPHAQDSEFDNGVECVLMSRFVQRWADVVVWCRREEKRQIASSGSERTFIIVEFKLFFRLEDF